LAKKLTTYGLLQPISNEELEDISGKMRRLLAHVTNKANKEKIQAKVDLQQKYMERLLQGKEDWAEFFSKNKV
jgi:hypothetical protein